MEKGGVDYSVLGSFSEADKGKLTALIEGSLNKNLISSYYDTTIPKLIVIAKEKGDYLGAAIIEEITPEISYIDKFVVHPDYKRNGIGGNILDIVEEHCPEHILRAKVANTHQGIYEKKGYQHSQPLGGWIAYWKGLEGANLSLGMNYALNKHETVEVRK